MNWQYGVTTVPARYDDLLPRTLASLRAGGFDKPRLFVDGQLRDDKLESLQAEGYQITQREPALRCAGNWILTLWELYIRQPQADRFAIFQDDLVTVRNLRTYLEAAPFPLEGYCNLYTFPLNQQKAPEGVKGFYESNQRGLGAVALVFTQPGARVLLASEQLVNRTQDPSRGHRSIDGGIVTAFKMRKWKEYVHNPSLVQHTGEQSAVGNKRQPQAISFPGEDFDAMELLPCKTSVTA